MSESESMPVLCLMMTMMMIDEMIEMGDADRAEIQEDRAR